MFRTLHRFAPGRINRLTPSVSFETLRLTGNPIGTSNNYPSHTPVPHSPFSPVHCLWIGYIHDRIGSVSPWVTTSGSRTPPRPAHRRTASTTRSKSPRVRFEPEGRHSPR